jgi:hypothetical protein
VQVLDQQVAAERQPVQDSEDLAPRRIVRRPGPRRVPGALPGCRRHLGPPPRRARKKAAVPCGTAEFREETSKKGNNPGHPASLR